MLKEFLKELGGVIGKTYTSAEFGAIVKEALEAEKQASKEKEESKK